MGKEPRDCCAGCDCFRGYRWSVLDGWLGTTTLWAVSWWQSLGLVRGPVLSCRQDENVILGTPREGGQPGLGAISRQGLGGVGVGPP